MVIAISLSLDSSDKTLFSQNFIGLSNYHAENFEQASTDFFYNIYFWVCMEAIMVECIAYNFHGERYSCRVQVILEMPKIMFLGFWTNYFDDYFDFSKKSHKKLLVGLVYGQMMIFQKFRNVSTINVITMFCNSEMFYEGIFPLFIMHSTWVWRS